MDPLIKGRDDVLKATGWGRNEYDLFKATALMQAKKIASFDSDFWSGVQIPEGLTSYAKVPGKVRKRALDELNKILVEEHGLQEIGFNIFNWRMMEAVRFQMQPKPQPAEVSAPQEPQASSYYDPIRDL